MSGFYTLGAVGVLILLVHWITDRRSARAYRRGYESGQIAANRWWDQAEVAVQEEREKIWKEGE